jgi:hypothetical protein
VTADDDRFWSTLDAEDPRLMVYQVYAWLAGVLESLLEARDQQG